MVSNLVVGGTLLRIRAVVGAGVSVSLSASGGAGEGL